MLGLFNYIINVASFQQLENIYFLKFIVYYLLYKMKYLRSGGVENFTLSTPQNTLFSTLSTGFSTKKLNYTDCNV